MKTRTLRRFSNEKRRISCLSVIESKNTISNVIRKARLEDAGRGPRVIERK